MPLLVLSLIFSGAGIVLCVGSDGRAALESANPFWPCAVSDCGDRPVKAEALDPTSDDCVDTLIPGFVTVRAEELIDNPSSDPLPSIWFTSYPEDVVLASAFSRWSFQSDPQKLHEFRALRSVTLLV